MIFKVVLTHRYVCVQNWGMTNYNFYSDILAYFFFYLFLSNRIFDIPEINFSYSKNCFVYFCYRNQFFWFVKDEQTTILVSKSVSRCHIGPWVHRNCNHIHKVSLLLVILYCLNICFSLINLIQKITIERYDRVVFVILIPLGTDMTVNYISWNLKWLFAH
jgi:hypothetical protein